MKKLFLLILVSTIFADTKLVPEVYSTIQAGIDAASDGDTVLVNDGFYYENLLISNSIVLASYAINDDLLDWIEENSQGEWSILNSHIENTHIIGSNPEDENFGSVILIT